MASASDPADVVIVFSTFPSAEAAAELARELVEDGLAACVNVIPKVRSIYRWEGKTCDESEALTVIKVSAACLEALRNRVVDKHPYDCPEVVALPVAAGHPGYLEWVVRSCQESS